MSSRSLVLSLAFAATASAALAQATPQTPAQQQKPPAQQTTPPAQGDYPESALPSDANNPQVGGVIKTQVNEVNLVFTVTDGHSGRFVRDLRQQDFELLDKHKPPAAVIRFTQTTDMPLRAGLLIDTSSSIHSRFSFEQISATDFLQQIIRRNMDQAFVMGFDTSADITQPFTNNVDALAHGIERLKSAGGTALYDALYTACHDQMLPIRSDESLRKTLVLLSDGNDNQSHATLDEAIKSCQRADTIVYTISTNISPSKDEGDEVLARMAEQTGGRAFIPTREDDVARAFIQIEDELRSQYSLEYRPADFQANGEFRPIWLVAVNRQYHVRATKGYFARQK